MCAALFLGTALLFSPVAEFGFLNYDDPGYVIANPYVQGGLSWSGLRWAFFSPADYWHPLPWLSHMLDWQLFGPSAGGHHLTSVLWHALNAVLAFLVFRRLAGGFWRSAFAAALFAWHPLRVESVAWVTERKDVMSGCFFLLTLLAYARYAADREAGRPARRSYLLVLAAFAAVTDTLSLAPGFEEALTQSLAEALAVSYGREITTELANSARIARSNIAQVETPRMINDSPFIGDAGMRFDPVLNGWVW